MSGVSRHRLPPLGALFRTRKRILLVALPVVIVLGAGAVVYASRDDSTAGGGGCGGRTELTVVAAPEIAPVIEEAAAEAVTTTRPDCPPISVVAKEPAAMADGKTRADVWVPSSSLWLKQATDKRFPATGTTIARSPLVVAMPKAKADTLGAQVSWAELIRRMDAGEITRFSVPDPRKHSDGMLTVLAATAAMTRAAPTDAAIAHTRTLMFRGRLYSAEADPRAILTAMAAERDPVRAMRDIGAFTITEQALWAHQRTPGGVPLAAVYPSDAMAEADYPFALSVEAAADSGRADLATRLLQRLRGPQAWRPLLTRGLRPPVDTGAGATAVPEGVGLQASYPGPVPPSDEIRPMLAAWSNYKPVKGQTLVLVDGSGSMNGPVKDRAGRDTTKAKLLVEAGLRATQLFSVDSSLGIWIFNTQQASQPYTEAVPYGPLSEKIGNVTRRDLVNTVAGQFQAQPESGTPLYEAVLRGLAAMRNRWHPEALTSVVVLTDGRDESSSWAMTLQQLLERIGQVQDPSRPVPVFAIGFGTDADMNSLQTMAKATGGQALASADAADLATVMAKVFFAARQKATTAPPR